MPWDRTLLRNLTVVVPTPQKKFKFYGTRMFDPSTNQTAIGLYTKSVKYSPHSQIQNHLKSFEYYHPFKA